MRRLIAPALFAAALPGLAQGQERPTLLDFFSFDVLMQRMLQSGIMLLRTQVDLKYSDMSVDLRTGGITLTDVQLWPLPDWDDDAECVIGIDRVTLRSGALDEPDRLRVKAQAIGVSAPPICLPEEPRQALTIAGLSEIDMPRATLDIDYGVPGSDATFRIYGEVTDVAAVDLTAEFAYIWMDGREDMEEPIPVVFLDNAAFSVENRGVWAVMKSQMPPPFTSDGAGLVVEGAIGQALIDMNRDAAGSDASDTEVALTDSQRAFVKSVAEAWPAFLAAPETLVLETQIDGDAYIDFEGIEDDLRIAFDAMQPRLALVPTRADEMLPVTFLTQALGPEAASMSTDDRKRVGIALVTGNGAPRNVEGGFELLNPLARDGDSEAAAVMSEALELRAPEDAYRWALLAGRAGETGATARLDRLERGLSFQRILELQNDVSGNDTHPSSALDSIGLIREQAAQRLSGRGQARSYEIAAMWAMLAKAAGDPEAADILADIDERVRLWGPAAQGPWSVAEGKASGLATEVWISQNLPDRYSK